jgi:heptosyltransferase I
MPLPFDAAPETLCILRLSAVGDVCHTLPVVRTIQQVWPNTKITWIIGKLEATLVDDISDIEFIVYDKSAGIKGYKQIYETLKQRKFDALLHMQMSLRSSLINRLIPTKIRIGFDKQRAKDLQWLFNNHQIASHSRQHVLDSFFGFAEILGIYEKVLSWAIPISSHDRDYIDRKLHTNKPVLIISPCSSMSYRNWLSERYAEVTDYAAREYNMQVVLSGGNSRIELEHGKQIMRQTKYPPLNLIGKTNLKQLLALLDRSITLISPDSGPAHMATAVGTPVIGLYACTNPKRACPYLSSAYAINRYSEAILEKYKKNEDQLTWGLRVRDPGTMARITVKDVTDKLDVLMEKIQS